MNPETKDHFDAVEALMRWFESQDIEADEAVPIMGTTIASIILTLAKQREADPKTGAKAFCDGMRKVMREMQDDRR